MHTRAHTDFLASVAITHPGNAAEGAKYLLSASCCAVHFILLVRIELQDDKLVNTAGKSHLHKNVIGKRLHILLDLGAARSQHRCRGLPDTAPCLENHRMLGKLDLGKGLRPCSRTCRRRGTAAAGRPRSPRSPLSGLGRRGGGSRARRPPWRAGTSRCRSRWAERTHTHTQTGRARASGDRAGRAGGAQLPPPPPPPPPPPLLVLPLVLMLRALRQRRAAQGCSAEASEGTQLAVHCKVAACHFLIIRFSSPGCKSKERSKGDK
nr:uncharacterized protein LOC120101002 [Rattus norvegicus]